MFRYSLVLFCFLPLLVQLQSVEDLRNDHKPTPTVQPTQPPAVRQNNSVKSRTIDPVLRNLIVVLLVFTLILLILCAFCVIIMLCVCFYACTSFYRKLGKEMQKRQEINQEMEEKEESKQPEAILKKCTIVESREKCGARSLKLARMHGSVDVRLLFDSE
ncbi:unnamed protein product, partial [Mesorhabditis belari]|uniref:Uncharacterized protein n=1 Tax=Mesorhabditis belari TaxID=2138241 RepID=A0AAF3EES5_9BILA